MSRFSGHGSEMLVQGIPLLELPSARANGEKNTGLARLARFVRLEAGVLRDSKTLPERRSQKRYKMVLSGNTN